jgi:2-haloacid dehalogenase
MLVLFDVNETLSDLAPLTERFPAARVWFASVLRDGFAFAVTGEFRNFASVARANLRAMGLEEEAAGAIMSAFTSLDVHPDVVPGVRALAGAGHRLATLSNGSASVAESLLGRAGVRDAFEALLSVDDAGVWKPGRDAYHYGLRRLGADPEESVLVAVHPWDIHGAARAGLRTAWVDRDGSAYPEVFETPTWRVASLEELPAALG